jgi:dipeptidyl aminopeptidase/acylaminoacyl peptidase
VPLVTRGNLLGPPVQELTVTLTEGTNMSAAPAPDGAVIVLALQKTLWRVPGGGGEATRLTEWHVEATGPVFSPDGSRIAFQSYTGSNYQIWTMAPDGSDPVQVTSGTHDHREPAWSPDGRKIAFSSDRAGSGNFDIWTVDLTTGTYEQRTSGATNEHSPAWAPDGASIAYADGRFVFAVDAAGVRHRLASVPSGSVQAPAWLLGGVLSYYTNTRRCRRCCQPPGSRRGACAGSWNVAAPVSARSSGRPATTSAWERPAMAPGCPQRATGCARSSPRILSAWIRP